MKTPVKYVIFLALPIFIVFYAIALPKKRASDSTQLSGYADQKQAILQNEHLKDAASFPIGVGFDSRQLNDPEARKIIASEFNCITTGSSIDWHNISPAPGKFVFGPADNLVAFAEKNGLTVIGHSLIWFKFTPDWLQNFQGDSAAWENLFKTHIQTIVSHFKGKIAAWDVVNEAFDEDGKHFTTLFYKNINKHYENVWETHLGTGYVARAFIYAHEADPNAVLFYNDNQEERFPRRTQTIVNMVNEFKARHIPIGGVGLQMHTNINISEDGIASALRQLSKTGVQIRISELDVRLNPGSRVNDPDSLENARKQADLYRFIAHAYKTIVPKDQQRFGISFWCVTDGDSWINNPRKVDAPLLFDEHYNKKPNYQAFIEGLKN